MDFEIQLPEEITNLMNGGGLPSPEMMNFYVDEKDRIFFIDFEIDQSLIEIERKILQYNRIDKRILLLSSVSLLSCLFTAMVASWMLCSALLMLLH